MEVVKIKTTGTEKHFWQVFQGVACLLSIKGGLKPRGFMSQRGGSDPFAFY